MAQRTIIELTDDLDGKPIPDGKGETIRFSLDRQEYEIDLPPRCSRRHTEKLPSGSFRGHGLRRHRPAYLPSALHPGDP